MGLSYWEMNEKNRVSLLQILGANHKLDIVNFSLLRVMIWISLLGHSYK